MEKVVLESRCSYWLLYTLPVMVVCLVLFTNYMCNEDSSQGDCIRFTIDKQERHFALILISTRFLMMLGNVFSEYKRELLVHRKC